MDRREFLRRAGLLAVAPMAGASLMGASKQPYSNNSGTPIPSNVLLILADDQPPHSVRRMERTMARFADGLDLTDTGYCAVPMCGPARVGLLTGLYPHNHEALNNTNPTTYNVYRERAYERDDLLTRMTRAGYDVGFFGKFINGYGDAEDPMDGRFVHPGVGRWQALMGGQNSYPYDVNQDGSTIPGLRQNHTAYFGGSAQKFMENHAATGKPWFCSLNWIDPHSPYQPPAAYREAHDSERYSSPGTEETDFSDKSPAGRPGKVPLDEYFQSTHEGIEEELELIDAWVGRLFGMLVRTGQLKNTIVIYSSDNGFMLGEHGGFSHKSHPYEESARAPYLVRGPGIPATLPSPPLVSHLDITATILAAADAPRDDVDGRPLQELGGSGLSWRDRLLVEHPVRNWSMVREKNWVYMDLREENVELYDLANDPYQLDSLHRNPEQVGRLEDLAAKLAVLSQARGRTEFAAAEGAS